MSEYRGPLWSGVCPSSSSSSTPYLQEEGGASRGKRGARTKGGGRKEIKRSSRKGEGRRRGRRETHSRHRGLERRHWSPTVWIWRPTHVSPWWELRQRAVQHKPCAPIPSPFPRTPLVGHLACAGFQASSREWRRQGTLTSVYSTLFQYVNSRFP